MNKGQQLLTEEYKKRKIKNQNFSLRSFARWLNLSPGQLSQMMSGKRPISVKSIQKLSAKLDLSPSEKKNLLHSSLEKKGMNLDFKDDKKIFQLQEDQFKLIADWYHFAILALTKVKNAQSDPRWVARQLGISVEEAHQALLRLERLRIIETKPKFRQISNPIQVFSDIPSEAIRKYHRQNLNLASEALDTVANDQREFQSISIVISPEQVKPLKKLIDTFLDEAAEVQHPVRNEVVYNLNVQLFPVSKLNEKKT